MIEEPSERSRRSTHPQNSQLNTNVFSKAYQIGQSQNRQYEVLTNTFHILQLEKQSKPGAQEEIKGIINQNMILGPASPKPGPYLDPKAVYPLSKAGGFGTLFRECQIVEKGVEQREGKGNPKLKQITGFINKIQQFNDKGNNKLQWIKQSKEYRFRIILQGAKKEEKAIYFKTRNEAERVKIYYINKFLYKGNFMKAMSLFDSRRRQSAVEDFKFKLIAKKVQDRKKILPEEQRNQKPDNISSLPNYQTLANQIDFSTKGNPVDKIINRASNSKTQQGYNTNMMNYLLEKDQSRLSSRTNIGKDQMNFGKILRLQKMYKRNLFEVWLELAKQAQNQSRSLNKSKVLQDEKKSVLSSSRKDQQNMSKSSAMGKSQNKSLLTEKRAVSIGYCGIQFLQLNNVFIKPIVTVSLFRNGNLQNQSVFNTMIKYKDPHLNYELVVNKGQRAHILKGQFKDYQINVKVIDYLTNSEICSDRISLKTKVLSESTFLLNLQKTIRLQIQYDAGKSIKDDESVKVDYNAEGNYLQIQSLSEKIINQIRLYWEEESTKRGYYNTNKNMKIIEILQMSEYPPKSWCVGLSDEQYKVVSILETASRIIGFKLTESILPITKILQKMYSQIDELIEVTLSLITNYLRPYYFPEEFKKLQKVHTALGLEGEIDFCSKIVFQMDIIKKIVEIQCPQFENKMSRRNISYVQLLYQYVYEMYAKNFPIRTLIEVWNYLCQDATMIQLYNLLLAAWLIKFYSHKLIKCRRFKQISSILESLEVCSAEIIIKDLLVLRQKYFGKNKNLIEEIKGMFNSKPLEEVVVNFYKRETTRMDERRQNREVEKCSIVKKLDKEVQIQIPKYPSKTYCLHIFFYKLPAVPGSLYIKTNGIEYECLNYSQNRYFIIGDVNTEIILQFVNNKSDEFNCHLTCMQGINRFASSLKSSRDNQAYRVEYLCGLLTETHIEVLKKNRKFQHYIGSFSKQEELFDEFMRHSNQSNFLNSFERRLEKEDLGKKVKVIFSSGSKNFNETELYLRWIANSPITLPEKLNLIKFYSLNLSQQFFLSNNRQIEKIFISLFLEMIDFRLTAAEFQSYYSDSLDQEFAAPKIVKCRLQLPNGVEHKLEKTAVKYFAEKSKIFVYGDIIINELLEKVREDLDLEIANISEGTLQFLYSSNGEIKNLQIPIVRKKTSKDLTIDQQKYEFENDPTSSNLAIAQPQILVTQILPTFSKITTILDFVNTTKSVQSIGKSKESKKMPQNLNLLVVCDEKIKKVIDMRYYSYPNQLKVPFLNYYHDLVFDVLPPPIPKNLFLNNARTDVQNICTFNGDLNFSDQKKVDVTPFNKKLGLYGNLRILPSNTQSLYFATTFEEKQGNNGQLFVNYGYGVFRWEPCRVLGYFYRVKERQANIREKQKPRKCYVVNHQGIESNYRQFQIQIKPEVQKTIQQLDQKSITSIRKKQTESKYKSASNISKVFNL